MEKEDEYRTVRKGIEDRFAKVGGEVRRGRRNPRWRRWGLRGELDIGRIEIGVAEAEEERERERGLLLEKKKGVMMTW